MSEHDPIAALLAAEEAAEKREAELEARIAKLEAERNDWRDRWERTRRLVDELTDQRDEARARVAELERDNEILRSTAEAQREFAAAAETKITELEEENDELGRQLAAGRRLWERTDREWMEHQDAADRRMNELEDTLAKVRAWCDRIRTTGGSSEAIWASVAVRRILDEDGA